MAAATSCCRDGICAIRAIRGLDNPQTFPRHSFTRRRRPRWYTVSRGELWHDALARFGRRGSRSLSLHAGHADIERTGAVVRSRSGVAQAAARINGCSARSPAWRSMRTDHVWIVHRPSTLQPNETRSIWRAAPPVLEFDQQGNLVSSWGGPGDGYEWPDLEHGIYVDERARVARRRRREGRADSEVHPRRASS